MTTGVHSTNFAIMREAQECHNAAKTALRDAVIWILDGAAVIDSFAERAEFRANDAHNCAIAATLNAHDERNKQPWHDDGADAAKASYYARECNDYHAAATQFAADIRAIAKELRRIAAGYKIN